MKRWKTGVVLMLSCLVLASCTEKKKAEPVGTNDPGTVDPGQQDKCKENPNDPSCKSDFCKTNPTDPSCTSDFCKTNPTDPSCTSDICKTNPNDPSCVTTGNPSVSEYDLKSALAGATMTITGKNLQTTSDVCFGTICVKPETAAATSVTAKVPNGGSGVVLVYLKIGGKILNVGQFTFLSQAQSCTTGEPGCTEPNPNEIDWCQTVYVDSYVYSNKPVSAYAQVYEAGKTGTSATDHDIQAEFGYADAMERDLAKFEWKPAKRNTGFSGAAAAANDEYAADNFVFSHDGAYLAAFRFSLDGKNWKYCGKNGPTESAADMLSVEVAPEPKPYVDWCVIANGQSLLSNKQGETSEPIYARVHAEHCTTDAGPCKELLAEVGYGPRSQADSDHVAKSFTWKEAQRNTAYKDDPDEDRVEYMANIDSPAADGEYSIAYRFSVDGGNNWFYCDTTDDNEYSGNATLPWDITPNGEPWDKQPGTTVDWCEIKSPKSLSVRAEHETEKVYAQAYVKNCTGHPYDKCANLHAQVGYGDASSADAKEFTYVDAKVNPNLSPSNNTEFMAAITPAVAGDYAVAYRFSLDNENWTYCDMDGSDDFQMAKTVPLHVDPNEDVIKWCRVQHPYTQTIKVGDTSQPIYGRVYVPNCSEGTSKCASVTAELGYGLKGTDKENFHYVQAEYNSSFTTTNNDEYSAAITINEPGGYDIVYRFSTNGGQTWTYCDFDDDDGFKIEKAASLIVKDDSLEVGWCRITNMDMNEPMQVTAGGVTQEIKAEAFVEGCTSDDNGGKRCSNLTAYVGYGSRSNNDVKSFKFFDAEFSKVVGNNNEFVGTFTAPTVADSYNVVYAFSVDGGKTMTYCDTDNDPSFDDGRLGFLKVNEPPTPKELAVDWCKIQHPKNDFTMVENNNVEVYGRVFVEGCTNVADGCRGKLLAQAGYGVGDDPSKFLYFDASYNVPDGPNEEYSATLFHVPANEVGEKYSIAYRFSVNDGKDWTYCDLDGAGLNNGSYSDNSTVHMTVKAPEKDKIGWCRMVLPNNATAITIKSGDTATLYGEAYVKDCTEDAASSCSKLHSFIAYGSGNHIDETNYTIEEKADATFDHQVSQNDLFAAKLTLENNEEGDKEYNVVYGFKLDSDTEYTWCDLDGQVADATISNAAKLTVKSSVKHVDWCQMFGGNSMELHANEPHDIYAQAYVPECTGGDTACTGLKGFLAYSTDLSETDPSKFTRIATDATYDKRFGYNDQFKASVQFDNDNVSEKQYRVIFGFDYTQNGKTETRYCDLNDDSTFETSKGVDLTVKKLISWCQMNFEDGARSYTVKPGVANKYWAQTFVYGCTGQASKCSKIHPVVRDRVDGNAVNGASLDYSKKVDNNDEYAGSVTFSQVGTYGIAVGFYAGDDASHITWCDMLNNDNMVGTIIVDNTDPINGGAPGITKYSPVSGKAETDLVIEGRNLSLATQVCFGQVCENVKSAASDKVTVTIPQGVGTPLVSVIVDGKSYVVGPFTYLDELPVTSEVDWCQTVYAKSPLVVGDTMDAYAQVYEPGVTGESGSHNIRVEFGIADEMENDPARISWFNENIDRNTGFESANNDEYMTNTVHLPLGSWRFAFRFSVDDGDTWTMCDSDGSQNGFSMDKMHVVDVTKAPQKTIDWCRIVTSTTYFTNEAGEDIKEDIYAQAHVANCDTDVSAGKTCKALKAQIGYGPAPLADGDSIAKTFTWKDATRNAEYNGSGGNDHDEFMAKVKTDTAGNYAIAYRFSVDDGRSWTYCDTTDDAAFSGADTIAWDVVSTEQEEPTNPVEWCRVMSPESLTVRANHHTGFIYGQLYINGCTGMPYNSTCTINGREQDIEARVIYGNSDSFANFTVVQDGKENAVVTINKSLKPSRNTEFMTDFIPKEAGTYDLYYQFRVGTNGQWVTCDYDDAPGYDKSKAVKLTVLPDQDVIGFCRVQYPETQTIERDETSKPYYGQVYIGGCTEGEQGTDGRCASIKAEIGYGLKDKDYGSFTYQPATHNPSFKGANDEYEATIEGKATGGYDVIYRFSTDDGKTWEYCDYDNEAGFSQSKAATLIVKKPAMRVGWCRLMPPSTVTATQGAMTDDIVGQAFVDECTNNDTQCTNLTAYVGYGTGTDVKDFTFTQAEFVGTDHNNNIFNASIKAPKEIGDYNLVYAFSVDGGVTKVYCDTADATGFDTTKLGKLVVEEAPAPAEQKVDWCRIWWPEKDINILENGTADVYGRVLVGGCTDVAGGCSNKLHAQLGYGSKDATSAADFTFVDATLNPTATDLGRNEEYKATLSGVEKGEYALAYRFSLDGENWTYCDRDDTAGYDNSNTLHLTVSAIPKDKIGWCQMRKLPGNVSSLTVPSGNEVELEGEVFVNKCTGEYGECKKISAVVAYGTGEDVSSYQTVNATYKDRYYHNDVFSAKLALTNNGDDDVEYNLMYGFKLDGDAEPTWCKLADDEIAKLKVKSSKQRIEWCSLYFDQATDVLSLHSGDEATIYGQAYVPGCTGKDAQCANLTAKLYYSEGEFSETANQSISASYDIKVGNNDQFKASFLAGNEDKHFAMKYGFQLGDGPVTWCGLNGSSDPADVVVTSTKVNWCRMYINTDGANPNHFDNNFASDAVRGENDETGRIWTQAYVEGCTGKSQPCDMLIPILAYGTGDDIYSFKQHNAGFRYKKPDSAPNNDEYVIDPILHNESGNAVDYKLAVGFRTLKVGNSCALDTDCSSGTCNPSTHKCNTLSPITWCDLDGTDNNGDENVPAFTLDQAINIRLASTDIVKNWGSDFTCGVAEDTSNGVIKGDIYVSGCTEGNVCADVKNPILYYSTVAPTDIDQITGWNHVEGSALAKVDGTNNNRSTASLPSDPGNYYYVYSFEIQDGERTQKIFCYPGWRDPVNPNNPDNPKVRTVDSYGYVEIK